MYYLVYFHRISVLTQLYIMKALKRARHLVERDAISLSAPLIDILMNDQLSPQQYCALTDLPVMNALFEWSAHPDPLLSTLCKRVTSRSEFHRRITGHPLNISTARKLMPELRQLISSEGYDPEEDLLLARTQKRGYFPYQEGILTEDGEDVRERSRLVKALESKIDEVMIFVPPECVERCVRHIDSEFTASGE